MQPHQQRVIDEKAELEDRLLKLQQFICKSPVFESLSGAEKELLREQAQVMDQYNDILKERIELFN